MCHLTGQDHSGIFGRGAEDCEEGVEDPKDQGQGLQELDAVANRHLLPHALILFRICFSMKIFSW
jgi:hypothetical protein